MRRCNNEEVLQKVQDDGRNIVNMMQQRKLRRIGHNLETRLTATGHNGRKDTWPESRGRTQLQMLNDIMSKDYENMKRAAQQLAEEIAMNLLSGKDRQKQKSVVETDQVHHEAHQVQQLTKLLHSWASSALTSASQRSSPAQLFAPTHNIASPHHYHTNKFVQRWWNLNTDHFNANN